jgi:hypothetical protein
MKANVRLRSNVVLRGDAMYERCVRGSDAVIKLLERKCPQLRGNSDGWVLFREASALEPAQILDVAWQVPCARCGCRPEGLVRGTIQFRCPLGRCTADKPHARTIDFTPELLARVKSCAGDIHQTVQAALEQYGREYSRETSLKPRQQFPIVVRLKPYQHLMYGGWTPKELSDLVEFALLRLIEET